MVLNICTLHQWEFLSFSHVKHYTLFTHFKSKFILQQLMWIESGFPKCHSALVEAIYHVTHGKQLKSDGCF